MSKQASEFQEKSMSLIYRGKEIFKPLNTGRIDERVSCVREFVANIFFYTKNGGKIGLIFTCQKKPDLRNGAHHPHLRKPSLSDGP